MMADPLHVERWGHGPAVTFLHGLGASGRYWRQLRDHLPDISAVAPDLLGFGGSPSPAASRFDVDAHLDALLPVLPAPSIIVAHSTGSILAAALAARHPELARGVLLLGAPAFPDAATAEADIGRLGLLARLTVDRSRWARWSCAVMCRLRPVAVAIAPHVSRDLPREIASDGARHTWRSYSGTLHEVVVGHRMLPDLLAYAGPTVALHGRDDPTAPLGYVQDLADMLGRAGHHFDLRVVDGDHHLAVRRPLVVAEAVRELCAG